MKAALRRFWSWSGPLAVMRWGVLFAVAIGLLVLFDLATIQGTLLIGRLGHGIVDCGGFLDRLLALPFCRAR